MTGTRDARAPSAPVRRPSCSLSVEHPGLVVRAFYAVGRRLFGDVPTPQKLMAHRPALMLGIGALWTSIERFGALEGRLRALIQLHVARLYDPKRTVRSGDRAYRSMLFSSPLTADGGVLAT